MQIEACLNMGGVKRVELHPLNVIHLYHHNYHGFFFAFDKFPRTICHPPVSGVKPKMVKLRFDMKIF